jgi:pimeloyl-ACP methyl ester carboxylesterase
MITHRPPTYLDTAESPDKDVSVYFANEPTRKAVLFIHGYHGEHLTTWSYFPQLMTMRDLWSGTDLFYYGYDGIRDELNSSAAILREFLDRLFTQSAQMANRHLPTSLQRADDFTYDELIIVGHSLGAVVARRMIVEATRSNLTWASKIQLVLFAPAHTGASAVDLFLEISEYKFLRPFSAYARFESPLIDQLKTNSPTLTQLLEDTTTLCAGKMNQHLIAKRVVLATREHIVRNERFGDDPSAFAIPGTSHTSVCKPRGDFVKPVEHLEEAL